MTSIDSILERVKATVIEERPSIEALHKQLDHAEAVGRVASQIVDKRHGPTVKAVRLKSGDSMPTELLTRKPVAISCTPEEIVMWYIDDGNIKRVH